MPIKRAQTISGQGFLLATNRLPRIWKEERCEVGSTSQEDWYAGWYSESKIVPSSFVVGMGVCPEYEKLGDKHWIFCQPGYHSADNASVPHFES